MKKILFIILITMVLAGEASAQVGQVIYLSEYGAVRRSTPRIGLSTSDASEGINSVSMNRSISVDPEVSQSIGYLAIGGALLGLYVLINRARSRGLQPIDKESDNTKINS